MMRRLPAIILLFIFVISFSRVRAQMYYTANELGIALGGSQYFGDLNDNYGFKTIGPAGGIYVRRRMNGYISLKIVADYTQVGYDDKLSNDYYDKMRNLNFRSDVIEMALQAEFNFFKFVTGDPYNRWTPFLTGGIGAFYYNPYTTYNGTKYYLRPLGTEGQFVGYSGRKYGDVSACFPIGAGFKFWIAGGVNLTLEIADRLTTTDYLDDVSSTYAGASKFPTNSPAYLLQDRSLEINPNGPPLGRPGKQRGNTASKDQYLMALLSISFHFTTYRCPHMSEDFIKVKR
ncbi:MAG: DUF6089 family protein [Chitinophagales bacterium]